MVDLKYVISKCRELGIKDYNLHKGMTNTDMGKEMIVFCTRTLSTRKLSDWGSEEDTDRYIGLDAEGWIEYTHDIGHMAGVLRISNECTTRLSDEQILSFLLSNECITAEYVMFMSTACFLQ